MSCFLKQRLKGGLMKVRSFFALFFASLLVVGCSSTGNNWVEADHQLDSRELPDNTEVTYWKESGFDGSYFIELDSYDTLIRMPSANISSACPPHEDDEELKDKMNLSVTFEEYDTSFWSYPDLNTARIGDLCLHSEDERSGINRDLRSAD